MANRVRHSSGSPGAGGIFRRALFDRETRSGHRGNSGRSVLPRRGEQNESEGRAAVRVGSSGEVHHGLLGGGFGLRRLRKTCSPGHHHQGVLAGADGGDAGALPAGRRDELELFQRRRPSGGGGQLGSSASVLPGNRRQAGKACRAGTAISTASRGTTATAEATPTRSRRRKRTRGGCTTCWGMSGSGRQTGTEATRRAQPLIRRDPYPGNLERCGAGLGTMVRGTRACRTVAGSSQATVTTISGCGARGNKFPLLFFPFSFWIRSTSGEA